MRRRSIVVLLLLLAACRMEGITPVGEDGPRFDVVPERFRILCWNTRKGSDHRFEADLARAVQHLRPDLIFLQEVRPDRLPEGSPGGVFAPSWRYPWPGGRAVGVATLSRARVVDPVALRTESREVGIIAPKTSVATLHRLANGQVLLSINVHLLAFEGGRLTNFRRQLARIGERMSGHEGPILMAGDFNTWSLARLEVTRGFARSAGLTEIEGFGEGRTTADRGSDFWNKLMGIDPALPLDRGFHRGLEVIRAEVLEQDSSDHQPLLVDFRVAE